MTTIPLDQFNYHKEDKGLSQELSMLEHAGYKVGMSIDIKSHFTGKVIRFELSKIQSDASNEDIYWWEYKPTGKCNITKLQIWND